MRCPCSKWTDDVGYYLLCNRGNSDRRTYMGNPINWLTKFTSQKLAVGASCNWVSFNFRCPLIDAENHWYFLSQWSSRFLGLKQVCTGLLWVLSVSLWYIFFGVVIGILFTLVLIYRHSIEIRSYMASYNWDKKLGHFILKTRFGDYWVLVIKFASGVVVNYFVICPT